MADVSAPAMLPEATFLHLTKDPPVKSRILQNINFFRVPGHDVSATERGVVDLPPVGVSCAEIMSR